jgi:AraC family transcriptional regulator, transcriptional activator of pobA
MAGRRNNNRLLYDFQLTWGRRNPIDPMRGDFYKIALGLKGQTTITIGLEIYYHGINTVAFTIPDQIFSISDVTEEVFGYYILFTAEFMKVPVCSRV